jgi:hypothetical protein
MIWRIAACCLLLWLVWRGWGFLQSYLHFRFYKRQGVVFMQDSFSLVADLGRMMNSIKSTPHAFSWSKI